MFEVHDETKAVQLIRKIQSITPRDVLMLHRVFDVKSKIGYAMPHFLKFQSKCNANDLNICMSSLNYSLQSNVNKY